MSVCIESKRKFLSLKLYIVSILPQNQNKTHEKAFLAVFSHTVFLFFPQSNFSHSIFPRFRIEPHDILLVYYNNDTYTFAIELTKVKRRNTNKVAKHTCELSTRQKRSDTTQKKKEKKKAEKVVGSKSKYTHRFYNTSRPPGATFIYISY